MARKPLIDADGEVRPLTEEDFKYSRPLRDVHPEVIEAARRGRGPQKRPTKESVSLRLDKAIIDHFRDAGSGWQTRINDALRRLVLKL
jgi:uncharacterized protein (DUF4415 family)